MPRPVLHVKIETSDGEVLVDEEISKDTAFERVTAEHAKAANESGKSWKCTISDPDDLIPDIVVLGGSRPN